MFEKSGPKDGGGYIDPGKFIEYAKGLSDQLNAWHSRDEPSMNLYDSIFVFEKGPVVEPHHEQTGTAEFIH